MPPYSGKYTYELVENWAKLPAGWNFNDVAGVSIDANDRIYILNRSAHPLMVFDRGGNMLTTWGEGYFKRPHEATFGADDSVWCADDLAHVVTKFTREGKVLMVLGTKDKPSDTGYDKAVGLPSITKAGPPFNRCTGVALTPEGEIFVSDGYGNARVHKFSPDGKLLKSWGEPGTGPGQFKLVHNVWFEKKNRRVWICDRENNRIQIFDENGKFLNQWTDLLRPTDVFIDKDDIVYVSELTQRVSIFTLDGKVILRLGSMDKDYTKSLFVAPHTLSVDSKGDLYVGEVAMTIGKIDRGTRVVQKFVRKS
jgi:DNA-binding beta-propeller fold protein YncE